MVETRGYIDERGNKRFANWFTELDANAAAKVTIALTRMEHKIDFGPGYRIYFGKDGGRLVILIGGGTKKRQAKDVAAAKACWTDYKRRKKQERNNATHSRFQGNDPLSCAGRL